MIAESTKLLLEERVFDLLLQLFLCPLSWLVITRFAEKVSCRLVFQLIKGISGALKKLLRYFSGRAMSTSFVLSAAEVFPIIIFLNLNNWVCYVMTWIAFVVFEYIFWCFCILQLMFYSIRLYIGIVTSKSLA